MRRILCLLLALVLAGIGGLVYLDRTVGSACDDVTFTETVLVGDRGAAAGLTAVLRADCTQYLHWETTLPLGGLPESDFTFNEGSARLRVSEPHYTGVWFELTPSFGVSVAGGISVEDDERLLGMQPLFAEVAAHTAPGQETCMTLRMADWFDYYPVLLNLDIPASIPASDRWCDWNYAGFTGLDVSDLFPIPVVAEHTVSVMVEKQPDGTVYSVDIMNDAHSPNCDCFSALTDCGCYFGFSTECWGGGQLDVSELPLGYGVYLLPYTGPENERMADPEGITCVFPLPEGALLRGLDASADGTRLFLLTQQGDTLWLDVLDAATAEALQRIEVMTREGLWYADTLVEPELYLVTCDSVTAVLPYDSGACRLAFLADETPLPAGTPYYSQTVAWDGTRFAMAGTLDYGYNGDTCQYYIAVYDESGPLYAGVWQSSLGAPSANSSLRCDAPYEDPILLRF